MRLVSTNIKEALVPVSHINGFEILGLILPRNEFQF
jgi:hypothetical protein